MHEDIRKQLRNTFGDALADATRILYGGSCKPSNAEDIFSQKDVDGGLIGGASLVAEDFIAIVDAADQ
jgi:triosephosphate isomerase